MPAGRPRLPEAHHRLRGTFREDRHGGGRLAPPPLTVAPKPPTKLGKVAKREWKRVAQLLVDQSVLTDLDLVTLEGYCAAYELARRAEAELTTPHPETKELPPLTMRTPMGVFPHPAIKIAKGAWADALKFAQQLGLTPVTRGKVTTLAPAGPRKVEDPWEGLAGG